MKLWSNRASSGCQRASQNPKPPPAPPTHSLPPPIMLDFSSSSSFTSSSRHHLLVGDRAAITRFVTAGHCYKPPKVPYPSSFSQLTSSLLPQTIQHCDHRPAPLHPPFFCHNPPFGHSILTATTTPQPPQWLLKKPTQKARPIQQRQVNPTKPDSQNPILKPIQVPKSLNILWGENKLDCGMFDFFPPS